MSRKSKPLRVRMFVPDGNGGYRDYMDLTAEEREAFGEKLGKRLCETLNDYYNSHSEKWEELRRIANATG